MIAAALTFSAGCASSATGREEIQVGSNKITVLDTKSISEDENSSSNKLDYEKIDQYEGVRGEGWLSDDTILVTKENQELEPIQVFDQTSRIRNLYAYDLMTRAEKSLTEKTAYIWAPIISPDGKHVLYEKFESGVYKGVISDLEGSGSTEVHLDPTNGYNLSFSQAEWVNNDEVLVPTSNNGVCLINVNSTVENIDDIGLMQTDHSSKVSDAIFYVSTDRNLVAYDIPSKRTSIVKRNVLEFELSPNKDMFAIQKKLSDGNVALVLTDLSGKETATLTKSIQVFGLSWSPDQKKLAYLSLSNDESKNGLHIFDLQNSEDLYVSGDFLNADNGLLWSPSGKKILASISKVKETRLIDNTYVITLK